MQNIAITKTRQSIHKIYLCLLVLIRTRKSVELWTKSVLIALKLVILILLIPRPGPRSVLITWRQLFTLMRFRMTGWSVCSVFSMMSMTEIWTLTRWWSSLISFVIVIVVVRLPGSWRRCWFTIVSAPTLWDCSTRRRSWPGRGWTPSAGRWGRRAGTELDTLSSWGTEQCRHTVIQSSIDLILVLLQYKQPSHAQSSLKPYKWHVYDIKVFISI